MEATKKNPLDMLHGSIWDKLPKFALPVATTAILEQLFNASDVAIVGNFTGSESTAAVASVGANSPIIGLIVNLLGANVVIAHAIGRGEKETVEKAPSLCPFWAADWWRFWGNGSSGRCCFSPRDIGAAAEQFLKLAIKE